MGTGRLNPERSGRRRGLLRVALGTAHVFGATFGFLLLVQTGMTPVALGAVVVTCLCTTVSVLPFGHRPEGK